MLLVLGHATPSWACSCVLHSACGANRYQAADFVGEVLTGRVAPSDDKLGGVLFEVRVIESFRGAEKAGEIVSVRTGFGYGDCGYPFKVGAQYLIDASRENEMFRTSVCSLTAPLGNSEAELRTLRRIAAGQRPPDLVGVLMRGTERDEGGTATPTPLPGVAVEAKLIAGGSAEKTITDEFGSFAFERLPQGKYELIL